MRRYRTCRRVASAAAAASDSGTWASPKMPARLPTGFLTRWARGPRNPPWLLLFLTAFWACGPPLTCSRVLPPAKMESDSSDMERWCTPCANAATSGLVGRTRAREEGRRSKGAGGDSTGRQRGAWQAGGRGIQVRARGADGVCSRHGQRGGAR